MINQSFHHQPFNFQWINQSSMKQPITNQITNHQSINDEWSSSQSINDQPSIIYQSTNHQANFANLAPGCTATQPLYQGLSDAQPQASGCTKATVPYPPPWRQQNSTPMPPPPSKLVPKSPNYPPPYATQQQLQQLKRKPPGEVHIHFHSGQGDRVYDQSIYQYTTYVYIYIYILFN